MGYYTIKLADVGILYYSMKGRKRELRYNSTCAPIPNIFKDEKYILRSGSHFLPEDIYQKLNKFTNISCDEINSFTFVRNEPH